MILTVGYQGLSLEDLRATVEARGIDRIIDVRSVPFSRKPGFNKEDLRAAFGRKYLWKGDVLGGRGAIREEALDWLARQEDALLLMCMEADPCDCHRFYELALRLLDRGVECVHLRRGRELSTTELKEVCDGRRQAAQHRLDFS
jgi:uncharacterized protein (DUF488 family)